jgi:hypothetical protein
LGARRCRRASSVQAASITAPLRSIKLTSTEVPGELAHNELKVAFNRGEIRAGLIGLTQRQRVVGLIIGWRLVLREPIIRLPIAGYRHLVPSI